MTVLVYVVLQIRAEVLKVESIAQLNINKQ